jgi:DNA-binding NarL/FixJ family response regulator
MARREGSAEGACVEAGDNSKKIKVILADDHTQVLESISRLLEAEFDVVCAVNSGEALVDAASVTRPDAVISDIQMNDQDGIEAGLKVRQNGYCDAVILLTMHNDLHLLRRALRAGIRGYVLKIDAGEELIPALKQVVAGGSYVSRTVRRAT